MELIIFCNFVGQQVNFSQQQNSYEQQQFQKDSYTSTALLPPVESTTPVPFETSQINWNQPPNRSNQQQQQIQSKSNLNAQQQTSNYNQYESNQQQSQVSKVKLNKLSSHENYLFNNRNAVQMLNNNSTTTTNINNANQYSDLNESSIINSFLVPDNTNYYHYDESIAASDL